jgi:hypothetical protein
VLVPRRCPLSAVAKARMMAADICDVPSSPESAGSRDRGRCSRARRGCAHGRAPRRGDGRGGASRPSGHCRDDG